MATTKAQYRGQGSTAKNREFSSGLINKLREFYPQKTDEEIEPDSVWGHPADEFVNLLLAEASWAVDEIIEINRQIDRGQLDAECDDMIKRLTSCRDCIQTLSPQMDQLLGIDAEPIECAENLNDLLSCFHDAKETIKTLPVLPTKPVQQRLIAEELAILVLRVLSHYEIELVITIIPSRAEPGKRSVAIQILSLIGAEVGIARGESAWQKIIIEVKDRV